MIFLMNKTNMKMCLAVNHSFLFPWCSWAIFREEILIFKDLIFTIVVIV